MSAGGGGRLRNQTARLALRLATISSCYRLREAGSPDRSFTTLAMTTFPCRQDFISRLLPVSSLAVTTAMDVHFLRCARVSQFKNGVEEEGMSRGIGALRF